MSSYTIRASPSDGAYHYHSIFGDICASRFGKLARFIFIASWALAFVTFFWSDKSWFTTVLPIYAIPHFIGFLLLALLRKNNLHVDHLGYKTAASEILGQLLSKKFALKVALYWISSLIFFVLLHSEFGVTVRAIPKKHQYPPLNDQFVFYYYMSLFVALIYSIHHTICDRDRLSFAYGTFHNHPRASIIEKIPSIVTNTIFLGAVCITSGPFVYLFVRHSLYSITLATFGLFYSLNKNHPSIGFSLGFFIMLSFAVGILIISWELVNVAFDAYMSIGCLHRGHTLSELSTDPLGTLLTGLKSDKLFTKHTAFQELAYIAKSENSEGRMAIYNRNNKREFIWGEILLECEKVIKTNNSNILTALSQSQDVQPVKHKSDTRDQHIFGRDYYGADPERREDDLFKQTPIAQSTDTPTFLDANIIPLIIGNIKQAVTLAKMYHQKFVNSGFGMAFRFTAVREAERLCPTPVIVGNAIIALSLITTHAYSEDKKGTVSSTVTDILEILEKSVSACGKFVQSPPSYLVDVEEDTIISILHEHSMNAFFAVTVQYSPVLKDVVLSPDVHSLVNWSMEIALNDGAEDMD